MPYCHYCGDRFLHREPLLHVLIFLFKEGINRTLVGLVGLHMVFFVLIQLIILQVPTDSSLVFGDFIYFLSFCKCRPCCTLTSFLLHVLGFSFKLFSMIFTNCFIDLLCAWKILYGVKLFKIFFLLYICHLGKVVVDVQKLHRRLHDFLANEKLWPAM